MFLREKLCCSQSRIMFIFIFLQLQTAASRSYVGSNAPTGINKDEDTSRFHTTKRGNFHEVFNLSENERPLAGIAKGKAALVESVLKS